MADTVSIKAIRKCVKFWSRPWKYYSGDDYYGFNYEYGLFGGPDCYFYMDYDTYMYVYSGECVYYSFDDYFYGDDGD